ncbi:capsule biosynthesis protein, partial [Campylobacter jejuni]|nr:capsule biosynthesis protein [Campylobacter jejuni]
MKFLNKIKNLNWLNSFKIVWILMVFVVIYYEFIAANRYVSSMVLDVRSTSTQSIQTNGLLS